MKQSKKLIALLLTVVLIVSVCVTPAAALNLNIFERWSSKTTSTSTTTDTKYPVILVHGLFGWGDYDSLSGTMEHFGLTNGSIKRFLNGLGTETYCASVGPVSSAWDRACELYAQLTGTVTDYGAEHAATHGHARYGRDYTNAGYGKLIKGTWNASNPVNLVGHSFGGATCRLLLDLLADGSAAERNYMAAHPNADAISPLFTGGKANWVYSLTTLAAPHDGTSFIECFDDTVGMVSDLVTTIAKALSLTSFKGTYDFQLEHFGIYNNPNWNTTTSIANVLSTSFLDHNDNAFNDLSIDKAVSMNADIQMQKNVYYFSWYGNTTTKSIFGNYRNNSTTFLAFIPTALGIGAYTGTTAGKFYEGSKLVTTTKTKVTSSWYPNDGMVNVISGKVPFHYSGSKTVYDTYKTVTTSTVKATATGTWYVMPEQPYDHLGFVGGVLNENKSDIQALYKNIITNIVQCGG